MTQRNFYKNYPLEIVFLANSLSVLIYLLGAFILYQFSFWATIFYLLYCLAMEINLLKRSCVHCWYYGKLCGFGKGKLCSLFFKKGKSEKFTKEGLGLLKLIPDFLVFVFPIFGGIILLIQNFSWVILSALALILFLSSAGNGFVRGQLVCKFCRQRLISCPAEKFFQKKK